MLYWRTCWKVHVQFWCVFFVFFCVEKGYVGWLWLIPWFILTFASKSLYDSCWFSLCDSRLSFRFTLFLQFPIFLSIGSVSLACFCVLEKGHKLMRSSMECYHRAVIPRSEIVKVPTTELWRNMTVVFTIAFGWYLHPLTFEDDNETTPPAVWGISTLPYSLWRLRWWNFDKYMDQPLVKGSAKVPPFWAGLYDWQYVVLNWQKSAWQLPSCFLYISTCFIFGMSPTYMYMYIFRWIQTFVMLRRYGLSKSNKHSVPVGTS